MEDPNVSKKSDTLQEVKYIPNDSPTVQKLKPEEAPADRKHDTFFLYISVLLTQLPIIVSGASTVWTSPALLKLKSNDTDINPLGRPITTVEISMISGLPVIFGLVGSMLLPKLSDIIGRKKQMLSMGFFVLVSGVALAFSNRVIHIVISKCLLGTALYGCYAVVPIFVAEICENHNRGKFGCFLGLAHQIGHLFAYLVGPVFSIKYFTLIITSPALVYVLLFFIVPESPIYLLNHGKERECREALRKLRSNKTETELDDDLEKMKMDLNATASAKKATVMDIFRVRENRIALMLALLPLMIQHFSGVTIIMGFLAPLFNAAGTGLSGNTVAILVSTIKTSSFLFTSFVVERFGRRRMLLFSSTFTGIPLFALGVYFYLQHVHSPYLQYIQWLPLVGIIMNVIFYATGIGPIPMAITSELFPLELRAASSCILSGAVNFVIFALISAFPIVSEVLGMHWCVWMFSGSCFIGAVLIYFFLPETKGKSFAEIQQMLKKF
uniref:Major facilitator superfamily protein n=1 Tax=Phyllotreta armoraciae TaxID=1553667 RepID=A0A858Z6M4_9CUCU|nr:major facilitator superfamily protein [Phyllotreta armoraciae]